MIAATKDSSPLYIQGHVISLQGPDLRGLQVNLLELPLLREELGLASVHHGQVKIVQPFA